MQLALRDGVPQVGRELGALVTGVEQAARERDRSVATAGLGRGQGDVGVLEQLAHPVLRRGTARASRVSGTASAVPAPAVTLTDRPPTASGSRTARTHRSPSTATA